LKTRFSSTLGLILILFTLVTQVAGGTPLPLTVPTKQVAYVEPALFSVETGTLPVIVTADTAQAATHAVEKIGGQVTSDLWLINAAAARIPANKLDTLASDPRVRSIVNNRGVKTADGPTIWDGYVTSVRVPRGNYLLNAALVAPVVYLPTAGLWPLIKMAMS